MSALSSKEKATLRGIAQTLKPAIHVGRQGLQAGAVAELQIAFARAELVKVAFKAEREELADLVAEVERATESECVGGVGKKRSFFRRSKREPEPVAGPWPTSK